MCEIEGGDVGGSSARTTSFPSTSLLSRPGPLSTTPSTLNSEWRYELLWLASLPLTSASASFLRSSFPDLPSRLRLPPGSLAFNFLNGFARDFRKSMSMLDRCGSVWMTGGRVRRFDSSSASVKRAKRRVFLLPHTRALVSPSDCYSLSFVAGHPS